MNADDALSRLDALAKEGFRGSQARSGIDTERLGVRKGDVRDLAADVGTDHALALALWETGIHEARTLASMIADPEALTDAQMEAWVADVDSWALCDQCCTDLFRHTDVAPAKARAWMGRDEEFVKRAGFVLVAVLARHRDEFGDDDFVDFLDLVATEADDDRTYVKKGASWAIREIGKRNEALRAEAIATARRLRERDAAPARWIARDVLDDLDATD